MSAKVVCRMTRGWAMPPRRTTRIIDRAFVVAAVALWLTAGLSATAEAPTVTETERLRVIALSQAMEIAQLKAQAAQRDYDQARAELRAVLAQLERVYRARFASGESTFWPPRRMATAGASARWLNTASIPKRPVPTHWPQAPVRAMPMWSMRC